MARILKALLLVLLVTLVTVHCEEEFSSEELMKEYDIDNDGKLSLHEIVAPSRGMTETSEEAEAQEKTSLRLGEAFKQGDVDGDGFLSLAEIPKLVEAMAALEKEEEL